MAIFGLVIVVGLAVALLAPHVDVELTPRRSPMRRFSYGRAGCSRSGATERSTGLTARPPRPQRLALGAKAAADVCCVNAWLFRRAADSSSSCCGAFLTTADVRRFGLRILFPPACSSAPCMPPQAWPKEAC